MLAARKKASLKARFRERERVKRGSENNSTPRDCKLPLTNGRWLARPPTQEARVVENHETLTINRIARPRPRHDLTTVTTEVAHKDRYVATQRDGGIGVTLEGEQRLG